MHFQVPLATLVALLASSAQASFYITYPIASTVVTAPKAITLTWLADSGATAAATPLASTFGPCHVGLYTGSVSQQIELAQFGTMPGPLTRNNWPVQIDPSIGPDSDLYFFRFTSLNATDADGVALQSFSARFTLRGMNGTWTAAQQAAISGVDPNASLSAASTTLAGGASTTGTAVTTAAPTTGGIQTAGAASTTSRTSSAANASASAHSGAPAPAGRALGGAGKAIALVAVVVGALAFL
ncbi:hypothetical protein T439DRAFT_382272 [Meredithblackwellia eburnea MCA 4105]